MTAELSVGRRERGVGPQALKSDGRAVVTVWRLNDRTPMRPFAPEVGAVPMTVRGPQ